MQFIAFHLCHSNVFARFQNTVYFFCVCNVPVVSNKKLFTSACESCARMKHELQVLCKFKITLTDLFRSLYTHQIERERQRKKSRYFHIEIQSAAKGSVKSEMELPEERKI